MKLRSRWSSKKKSLPRERERSKTETEKDVESFLISYHTHYTTTAGELYCSTATTGGSIPGGSRIQKPKINDHPPRTWLIKDTSATILLANDSDTQLFQILDTPPSLALQFFSFLHSSQKRKLRFIVLHTDIKSEQEEGEKSPSLKEPVAD